MKIGILTLHRAHNFGAVLQALALQTVLEDRGHNVSIIDFTPYQVYGYYNYRILSRPLGVRSIAAKTLCYISNRRRWKAYTNFIKTHLHVTESIGDMNALLKMQFHFDAYICGSDQVWNPNIVGPVLGAYMLNFVKNARKIAYAASYGDADAVLSRRWEIGDNLMNFSAISVREDEGILLTRIIGNRKAVRVLDPILLLPAHVWDQYLCSVAVQPRYMLVYMLGRHREAEQMIRKAAGELRLPVVNLGSRLRGLPRGSRWMRSVGPREFLYLVRNAQCVCTNSFHGTGFSILYGKPFAVFQRENRNTRLSTLLKTMHMTDRFIPKTGQEWILPRILETACEAPPNILARQRKQSLDFLDNALQEH